MTRLKLQTTGAGSDRSTNSATTTAQKNVDDVLTKHSRCRVYQPVYRHLFEADHQQIKLQSQSPSYIRLKTTGFRKMKLILQWSLITLIYPSEGETNIDPIVFMATSCSKTAQDNLSRTAFKTLSCQRTFILKVHCWLRFRQ